MYIINFQTECREKGELGFGGSIPCAQTKGLEHQTFYYEGQHPEELLRLGHYDHMPILMGANSHEGSYVYGGNCLVLHFVGALKRTTIGQIRLCPKTHYN